MEAAGHYPRIPRLARALPETRLYHQRSPNYQLPQKAVLEERSPRSSQGS